MKTTKLSSILSAATLVFTMSLPCHADTTDANVPTSCKDGTTSTATGRGACSGHGGVKSAAAPTAAQSAGATPLSTTQGAPAAPAKAAKTSVPTSGSAAPTTAAAPAPTSQPSGTLSTSSRTATEASKSSVASKTGSVNTDPKGATAECKDGTFSHATTHSGSCSHHGGVAMFLKPAQ